MTGAEQGYGELLAAAAVAGRCPVWITGYGAEAVAAGWDAGAALAAVPALDASRVLAERWPGPGEFPGLLEQEPVSRTRALARAAEFAATPTFGRLALVGARRPADIPAAIGWAGGGDPVATSVVLRSWERRFGAVLTRLDRAAVELTVALAPWFTDECLRVAAEHVAFCAGVLELHTGGLATDTVRRYAQRLRSLDTWTFRWS
jgi:hypothetical protein